MCGIAGFVAYPSSSAPESVLSEMAAAIAHRGPDASGYWWQPDSGVGLAHRRLAILDLSPAGAQPMHSSSGRYVLAFNGEIYNFPALREELEALGHQFSGRSDTEVMLAAFEAWEFEQAISRFTGMFAFALVDRQERCLYLARDRMGEKPLYYATSAGQLLFGSELKALRQFPGWHPEVNLTALALLLRHNQVPAPATIYQDTWKLPPASYLRVRLGQPVSEQDLQPRTYWHLSSCFRAGPMMSLEEATDQLQHLLGAAIRRQMVADVPLGAFLSGGVDSSVVVALMQAASRTPVRTFTIGFHEAGFDEAAHAAAVARHLGTEHSELYVTADDVLGLVPGLPAIYDEPFADPAQLPGILLSRLARQQVTVALSGDGGDELFCGYTRYPQVLRAWQRRHTARSRLRQAASLLPPALASRLIQLTGTGHRGLYSLQERLVAERELGRSDSLSEYYRNHVSFWARTDRVLSGVQEPPYMLTAPLPAEVNDNELHTLMWRDLNWYLPDDILAKVDRAAMASSLETRIPLLDPDVIAFALSLPPALNEPSSTAGGKRVLRNLLYRHVPRQLVDRPKKGFAVPIGAWLRTELREWAEELLRPSRLQQQGYWHTGYLRKVWAEHSSGRADHSWRLWSILMYQAWLDHDQRG
ncbi:MAG: asparagine synthase (glutamine-hydrolyzing) [Chromatiales bacterium]|nr:asparagine synthase (glutamine-hydrolyzing) [Chromatiales bacterium]